MAARLWRLACTRPPVRAATHDEATRVALNAQQQLVEELMRAKAHEDAETERNSASWSEPENRSRADVEHTTSELLRLREVCGGNEAVVMTTAELTLQSTLRTKLQAAMLRSVVSYDPRDPHAASETALNEVAAVLTSLIVKSSPSARALGFECLLDVVSAVTVARVVTCNPFLEERWLFDMLFTLAADMIHKSVAVAGSTMGHGSSQSTEELAWIEAAIACVVSLTRWHEGRYRPDRLSRFEPPALAFMLSCVYSQVTEHGREVLVQEMLLEIVISAIYTHANGQKRSVEGKSVHLQATIDRFGGNDLFTSIFFMTSSEWSRRMLFVLFWDLAVALAEKETPHERDDENASIVDSVLEELLQSDLLKMLWYVKNATSSDDARSWRMCVRGDYAESALHEVDSIWTSLRLILQVDEFIPPITSLQKTVSAVSLPMIEQTACELLHDVVSAKAKQLLASTNRLEDRFKGERWLAGLLVFGIKDLSEASTHGLLAQQHGCVEQKLSRRDETADLRQCARATLWNLLKSGISSERLSAIRILRQVATHFAMSPTSVGALCAFATELMNCLSVCLSDDPCVALVVCASDMILMLTAVDSVAYLDRRQQAYDVDCYEVPSQLVGVFINSESVASKLLRGHISVDRTVLGVIPISLLLQLVATFDSLLHPPGICRGGCCGTVASFEGDCMAAIAVLLWFQVQNMAICLDTNSKQTLNDLVDACDSRVAVIAARAVTRQARLELGEAQYMEALRTLCARAVEDEDEDETTLTSSVGIAKALAQRLLTP